MPYSKSVDHQRASAIKMGAMKHRAMPLLVDKQTHDSFFALIAGFDDYLEKNSTNVTTQFCKVIL